MIKKLLVTGAGGLIGSEVVEFFCSLGWVVHGIENNMRAKFFGEQGDTSWNVERLVTKYPNLIIHAIDIRNRDAISNLLQDIRPDAIIHTAAQPSHDYAAKIPYIDFDVNAVGTLNLLEATRLWCKDSPFVHMSTNKVYGDSPNEIKLKELDTRWDYDDAIFINGIPENFKIDQCTHSLFGVSKLAADIMVQEYGRYFNMNTCCLRGGCLTGPKHSGVELHGFVNYLIKTNIKEQKYTIFGYKGKQVRDNIHSYDVVNFIYHFICEPRKGEVYNIGGGRDNSISILEAFALIEEISSKKMIYEYVDTPRIGDHICYISNIDKLKSHYPTWNITKNLKTTFTEIFLCNTEDKFQKNN